MDYTASDHADRWDLDQWLDVTASDEDPQQTQKTKTRSKKRRKPLRKNRKPARPANYIGRRTNNRLLKICAKEKTLEETLKIDQLTD